MSSSVAASTITDEIDILDQVQRARELNKIMDGSSRERPKIVFADLKRPEKTGSNIEAIKVPNCEQGNIRCDAIYLRKHVSVGQEDLCEAEMGFVEDTNHPLYGRAIRMAAPAQNRFFSNPDAYHGDLDTPTYSEEELKKMHEHEIKEERKERSEKKKAKTEHKMQQTAIAMDASRGIEHTLLVFEEEIQMDNQIYSRHDRAITKGVEEHILEDEGGNSALDVLGSSCYWWIALKGSNLIKSPERKKKGGKFAARRRQMTLYQDPKSNP